MHTSDTELAVQKHLAQDTRRVSPGGLHLTDDRDLGTHRHGPEISHGDGATDVAAVEEPRARDGQERRRGQVVQQRGRRPTVQVARLVAQVRTDLERPDDLVGLDLDELQVGWAERVGVEAVGIGVMDDCPFEREYAFPDAELEEVGLFPDDP